MSKLINIAFVFVLIVVLSTSCSKFPPLERVGQDVTVVRAPEDENDGNDPAVVNGITDPGNDEDHDADGDGITDTENDEDHDKDVVKGK